MRKDVAAALASVTVDGAAGLSVKPSASLHEAASRKGVKMAFPREGDTDIDVEMGGAWT